MSAELDALRDDATAALYEVLAFVMGAKPGTGEQAQLAAKFYVTAQAKYTLACQAEIAKRD